MNGETDSAAGPESPPLRATRGTPEEIAAAKARIAELRATVGTKANEFRIACFDLARLMQRAGKHPGPTRQPRWKYQTRVERTPTVRAERRASLRESARVREEVRETGKWKRMTEAERRFAQYLSEGNAYRFLVHCTRYMGTKGIAALTVLAESGEPKIKLQALALLVRALEVTAKAEIARAAAKGKDVGDAGVDVIDPGWPAEGSKS